MPHLESTKEETENYECQSYFFIYELLFLSRLSDFLNYSSPPPPLSLQFEIVSQHLVFANCIPLILKFFNQNIMSYISAKNRCVGSFSLTLYSHEKHCNVLNKTQARFDAGVSGKLYNLASTFIVTTI